MEPTSTLIGLIVFVPHLTSPSAIVLAGATDLDRRGIDSGFA